jgi:hypothetical protein
MKNPFSYNKPMIVYIYIYTPLCLAEYSNNMADFDTVGSLL